MGLSEYLKRPWDGGLFYFFNLMLEIQALHLMEENSLGEGWESRKPGDRSILGSKFAEPGHRLIPV